MLEFIEPVVKFLRYVRDVTLVLEVNPDLCAIGYGCISRNFRIVSLLVMLSPLNNAEIPQFEAQIKPLEMKKKN
ncbi:hypothetical protein NCL65_004629 [Escherichia coli]|nr:hypothetical protein [Escherichia coli]